MSAKTYSLEVSTVVKAPIEAVWESLMDSQKSAEVFFGISFKSDLKKGSPITWAGVWEGKPFEDRGTILEIQPHRLFQYDYFSDFSGEPDRPENHQKITYLFNPVADGIHLVIRQENLGSPEKQQHSEANWTKMLETIKANLEK